VERDGESELKAREEDWVEVHGLSLPCLGARLPGGHTSSSATLATPGRTWMQPAQFSLSGLTAH
jgi:hypothetical protein